MHMNDEYTYLLISRFISIYIVYDFGLPEGIKLVPMINSNYKILSESMAS